MTKEIKKPGVKKQEKVLHIIDYYFKWIALVLIVIILLGGYFMVLRDKYSAYAQSKNTTLVGMKDSLKNAENVGSLASSAINGCATSSVPNR